MSTSRSLLAGLTVGLVAVFASIAPASAHDELLSSDPADDQALAGTPESVSLTFSADLLDVGAGIVVVDGSDRDWVAAEPTIDGPDITTPVETGMPDGGYEIRWRVVSSDGHPISGVIPFTVGDGEPLQQADTATDAGAGAATATGQAQTAADDGAVPRTVLVGASGAVIALALLVLFQLFRRRHRARGTS